MSGVLPDGDQDGRDEEKQQSKRSSRNCRSLNPDVAPAAAKDKEMLAQSEPSSRLQVPQPSCARRVRKWRPIADPQLSNRW